MTRLTRRSLLAAPLIAAPAVSRAQSASPKPAAAPPATAKEPLFLTAAKSDVRIRPEPKPLTSAWTFNGGCPGPTIRVKQGDEVAVRLTNSLEEETSIHWQGVRNLSGMDGVAGLSQNAVGVGQSFDYRFVARDAGTYFYQPCIPGRTSEQLDRGLYGVLIVDEKQPPTVDRDLIVVIDDWRLGDDGAILASAKPSAGDLPRLGNVLVVNGQPKAAEATIPTGGRARIRIVNAASTRILNLRFTGQPATIVAIDGQPSSTAFQPKGAAVIMTPGGRIDLMVDLPGDAGQEFGVLAQLTPDAALPVLSLKSVGDRRPALPTIAALPSNELPEKIDLARAQRAEVTIEGGPQPSGAALPWTLNKRTGPVFAGKPFFSTKRGTTVVITFHNRTAIPQAMRLHGHHGRLLFVFDDGWDPFWIDTALIQPGRSARLAFIADNPGKWALRSAIADLFDAGLGGWFEVT